MLQSMRKQGRSSVSVSLVALFASFNIVCSLLMANPLPYSGVWYSWVFVSAPITGIILGPLTGFFSVLVGAMIGHFIIFVDVYEFLFTLGAPLGAMISALVFKGRWRMVLACYTVLLAGYFVAPVAWLLPMWGMWDVYLAFAVLLVTAAVTSKWKNLWDSQSDVRVAYISALSAFIGLEADVLFRIFVLVPCQTYSLFYGWDAGVLQAIWAAGAIETPIKAALSTIITAVVGPPIIHVVRRMLRPV